MAYRPHAVAALASRRTDTGADHRRHAQVLIIIILGADQRDGRHAHIAARAGLVVVHGRLSDRFGLLQVLHHAFALPAAPQGFPIKIYSDWAVFVAWWQLAGPTNNGEAARNVQARLVRGY